MSESCFMMDGKDVACVLFDIFSLFPGQKNTYGYSSISIHLYYSMFTQFNQTLYTKVSNKY